MVAMTEDQAESFGIGAEIRRHRKRKQITLAVLAERAGLTKGYLSKIENGAVPIEKRSTLTKIAKGLDLSLADLGAQHLLADPAGSAAQDSLPEIRFALLASSLDEQVTAPGRPIEELSSETTELAELRQACKYVEVGKRLPALITDLHAVASAGGNDRPEALRSIVQAAQVTALFVKNLGSVDLAWVAAERGHDAATRLEDPLWIAASEFARTQALVGLGAYQRAEQLAKKAAAMLRTDSPEALEVYGTSVLTAAFCASVLNNSDPRSAVAEAADIARHAPGANAFFLAFSKANVSLWELSMLLELDDHVGAAEVASGVNIVDIPAQSRKTAFLIDQARALYGLRGRDSEVVKLLRRAEKLGPSRTRHNTWAQEIVAEMFGRARRDAGGEDLRGLADRMGMLRTL